MPRWLLVSLFGGALVTACVLPDVEIDPDLADPGVVGMPNQPGTAGAGVSVPPLGGSGGAAGQSGGDIDPELPPGSGGSASTDDTNAGGSLGGSGGAAGTGGAAGSSGAGGTGAGGTGAGGTGPGVANPPSTDAVIEECSQSLDRETACINYCQQYIEACGDFEANTYSGVADCTSTCIASLWAVGDTTTGSNSICCRWLHATLAAQLLTSQFPHCFHAAEEPSEGQTGGCAPGAGTAAAP